MTNEGVPVESMLTRLDWDHSKLERVVAFTQRVAEWNGNRRGQHEIECISDDLDHIYTHGVMKRASDRHNYGTCFYRGKYAFIHINPDAGSTHHRRVDTLAHELAHAVTQGAHGFTWRRMYAMLHRPTRSLFWPIAEGCDPWVDTYDTVRRAISRYGTGYRARHNNDWDGDYDIGTKWVEETDRHLKAAQRCWVQLGDTL